MLFKLTRQTAKTLGLIYLSGVGLTTLICLCFIGLNLVTEQALAQGQIIPFIGSIFPHAMYWSGTLLAIFVVGPLGFAFLAVVWWSFKINGVH